tara:strand:- start:3464 stop:3967 length:504 start_codon:yes stop_codon:yes gene_type:complete
MLFTVAPLGAAVSSEAGQYATSSDYVRSAYPDGAPDVSTIWVTGELREKIEATLGHKFAELRLRYWFDGNTSVWILNEIGKELPITIGVSVTDDAIRNVQVLEFRESRGWEVRYPFFTDQFNDVRLDNRGELDRKIDGITGATLSVRAVTRIANIALLLHDQIKKKN